MAKKKNPAENRKWKVPRGPKNTPHKNKNVVGLGRTIRHAKLKKNEGYYLPSGELRFTTEKHVPDSEGLKSVTQENSLDEFLSTAELQDKEFSESKTSGIKVIKVNSQVVQNSDYNPYLLSSKQEIEKFKIQAAHRDELTIPRRPKWDKNMSTFELDKRERDTFLEWRRHLAALQQDNDLLLTPFERNLNLWKQLWRVVERSDLIVQIVDARNPLLFRSYDLVKYVKEQGSGKKRNLLLVNKADLLTLSQRKAWAKYFSEHGIAYTFFSAAKANEIIEKQREEEDMQKLADEISGNKTKPEPIDDDNLDALDDELDDEEKAELAKIKEELAELDGTDASDDEGEAKNNEEDLEDVECTTNILTVEELEALFLKEVPEPSVDPATGKPRRTQIGLVGYPNVGKSSTINALVGSKKVSVSSTPGKTKHYQTIILSDKVLLCDCPGLVFPNFAYTNAELVCNGVLPIDQLRESTGPAELVTRRIPKYFLEAMYGIKIDTLSPDAGGNGVPTARELLNSYARARGYMTSGFGSADINRAARYILKDYVSGKLLYVDPPPHEDGSRRPEAECRAFNEELYSLKNLPEHRQQQVISVIQEKGISVDKFDLARDFENLHITKLAPLTDSRVSAKSRKEMLAQKEAALDLDKEFFQMSNVQGIRNVPFHSKKQSTGGKKHNKKNKKSMKKVRLRV